jgi:hypothetical protein
MLKTAPDPLATPYLTRGKKLRDDLDVLTQEVTHLAALAEREPHWMTQDVLGEDPDAAARLAECRDAATRLPDARRRLAASERAVALWEAQERDGMRQADLGYAGSLLPEFRALLVEKADALLALQHVQARLSTLQNEIEEAQDRADALRLDRSLPNEHPVSWWVRQLGYAFHYELLGDHWNPSPLDRWLQDAEAQGIRPSRSPKEKGRKA